MIQSWDFQPVEETRDSFPGNLTWDWGQQKGLRKLLLHIKLGPWFDD